jgi:hypothetical protein
MFFPKDYHFHYVPEFHNDYFGLLSSEREGLMVIHYNQLRLPNFKRGIETFKDLFPIGVELSGNKNFLQIKDKLNTLLKQNYKVILSIHSYKDLHDFLETLKCLKDLMPLIHHIGHPFHKERSELPTDIIEEFIAFCKDNNVFTELNERYLRSYNINLYDAIKNNLPFYYSTDAHVSKGVFHYNKMNKYHLL